MNSADIATASNGEYFIGLLSKKLDQFVTQKISSVKKSLNTLSVFSAVNCLNNICDGKSNKADIPNYSSHELFIN
ncbi:hypothetical protein VCRA2120O60_200036 [Vibrio crassostreae]|nr:hypothetical protein VCRA2117O39_210036 [Vibrio crassostreae]CAK2320583.1 hypothetical protein VCRA2119O49_210042 [Vibrio crassostreae]CAK2783224.1 hypothetical protein VCRA2125O82_200036 [Vibrio crassostreae]CAK3355531.1 hypothetical protein VCRA2120O61_210036 [Vibrio crassostreae]CAK3390439.1 hypothetical protein VCRA2128O103_210042 [Vibrio crassostreae]